MKQFEPVRYCNLTPQQKQSFFSFCEQAGKEVDMPAHENMWHDDWTSLSYTLPFILEKTDRFKGKGEFFILFDDAKPIACAGVYQSDFCDELAIAGVRTWVHKDYRNQQVVRFLLYAQKQWSIDNGYKAVALTFNEYNKNIISIFKRARLGENAIRFKDRTPKSLFYNGLHEVSYPVMIRNTPQWVIYERLERSWDFNWSSIQQKEKAA